MSSFGVRQRPPPQEEEEEDEGERTPRSWSGTQHPRVRRRISSESEGKKSIICKAENAGKTSVVYAIVLCVAEHTCEYN